MKEDLIQLPDLNEVKELLDEARANLKEEIQEFPELAQRAELITEVIKCIEEKFMHKKDMEKANIKEKIDFAAHLTLLQNLMQDFYFIEDDEDFDSEFDDEDFDELEDLEFQDDEDEDTKK